MHAQFSLESQLSFIDFPPQFLSRYIETNVVAVNTNFPRWIDFGAEKSLHSSTYTLNSLEKWANPGQYQEGGYTNWVIAGVLVHQDMLGLWTFGRPIGGSGHPPQKHAAQGVCAHSIPTLQVCGRQSLVSCLKNLAEESSAASLCFKTWFYCQNKKVLITRYQKIINQKSVVL